MVTVKKIGRLFQIKTRFEAWLVIYAIALGAVERGRHYLETYPGLGGWLTNLAIGTAGVCHFTRVTTGGLDAMITDLAERRALTREHAEQWLEHVGLTSPIDAIEGDPEIVGE